MQWCENLQRQIFFLYAEYFLIKIFDSTKIFHESMPTDLTKSLYEILESRANSIEATLMKHVHP